MDLKSGLAGRSPLLEMYDKVTTSFQRPVTVLSHGGKRLFPIYS